MPKVIRNKTTEDISEASFKRLNDAGRIAALRGITVERAMKIERQEDIDEESRTVWLSISSDEPYRRWWGIEILDHESESIRDERLASGAAILVGHDTTDQVGVVEEHEINAGKLRVKARFSRSARAEEIWQDVLDGIRRNASVGYVIHDMVLEERSEDVSTYRVTDWEVLEGSIVPVPADPSVGVGRQMESITMPDDKNPDVKADDVSSTKTTASAPKDNAPDASTQVEAERKRVNDLIKAGRNYEANGGVEVAEKLITEGKTVADFNAAMLARMGQQSATPDRVVTHDTIDTRIEPVRYSGNVRAWKGPGAVEKAYKVGMWCRAMIFRDQRALSWCRDNMDMRALGTGTGPKGGYLVPEEMAQGIIDLREVYGIARSECDVMPMGSDVMNVPRRVGGATVYFVSDNAEITASDPTWDQINLTAKKMAALTKFSTELAEDAVVDVGDRITSEFAWGFAKKEDECLIDGDGTSTYGGIYGIRTKIINGNHTAGAVDAASGIDTFAEVTATDLSTAMAACPQYAIRGGNAKWYVSQPGFSLVFERLTAAAGGNTIQTLGERVRMTYLGYEVVVTQAMPTSTGDLSDEAMLLFGDMRMAATLGDRRDIRIFLSEHRFMELDQIAITATERFDINAHDLGDTSTAGPIVALIGE